MDLRHQFLAIDEGRQSLHLVDTTLAEPVWRLDLRGYPLARDLQRIAPTRALVGHDRGFFEVDIPSGRLVSDCATWTGVTAVHRMPDGRSLLTGLDLDGSGGVQVLTLDADNRVVDRARRDGDYVRLMRVTPQQRYLLCTDDRIVETDRELRTLREYRAEGFRHAWMAQRCADGTTLVSAGYGAFMARFDADANLIASFGHATDLPVEIEPHFYASFQVLANGHVVVVNWAGHGPDHAYKGRQLLEFAADGQFLGSWSSTGSISSLQGMLVLQ